MEAIKDKIKFNPYPSYKPSGAEWLGEIPEHWEAIPGFTILYEAKEKNKGMKRTTVLSLSYGKIRVKGNDELTGLVPESFETYQFVNKGDIIFRPTDLQNDHVSLRSGMSEFDGIITSAYLNLRLKPIANSKFYSYLFRGIDNNKVIYGLGSGLRQNIDFRDFKRFKFPFPPLHEQIAISTFLDRKTTQIEQAIAQKERMIELLKERRQILIQNAVSKGLNPNVKMKDSGVEWIGEIPEHWDILSFRHCIEKLTDFTSNGSFASLASNVDYLNEGYSRLIRLTDLRVDLKNEGVYVTEKAHNFLKNSELLGGELLIANVGAYAGFAAIMPTLNSKSTLGPNMLLLKLNQFNPYYAYLLNSPLYSTYIMNIATATAQPKLNKENIRNIKIIRPTIVEQQEIVRYIESVSHKFTRAISLKEKEIENLKEYKASLINEAVTGKIKVSGV